MLYTTDLLLEDLVIAHPPYILLARQTKHN